MLIVAPEDDLHANAVAARIEQLWPDGVRCLRLDLATYPIATGMEWRLGSDVRSMSVGLTHRGLAEEIGSSAAAVVADWPRSAKEVVDAKHFSGIWWRRPRRPLCHPEVVEPEYRGFCQQAAEVTLRSFFGASTRVYNDPDREARAGRKPLQLQLARLVGLRIPETLITTDEAAVLRFEKTLSSRRASVVFKGVANPTALALPTRRLRNLDRKRLASLRYAPGIFQEFIDGTDLRIAVLDNHIFCCDWRSDTPASCSDIRLVEGARMWRAEVPDGLAPRLLRLHRRLGLSFGVYDFRMRPGEEPVFLEVNPTGQWLDMELEGRHPIGEAWARKLVKGSVQADELCLRPLTRSEVEGLWVEPVPPTDGWVDRLNPALREA